MTSLLNEKRPPVFCPGCAHERIVGVLDRTLTDMGLAGNEVVLVSDIGCSGLFDTFFHTHALHGLHGRALTYATGIKMARPELKVIVTMGDGGLGIGGAHVLSTCRRNIDLTLLVLNNFNYGMTGGQCSSTTPADAQVESGFLNRLEAPIDICRVAAAAGAEFATRVSSYDTELSQKLKEAISHDGFSLVDIWGICPGRYSKRNRVTPKSIAEGLEQLPDLGESLAGNAREEYSRAYRAEASKLSPVADPEAIEATFRPPQNGRQEIVLLGSAGQRIITAGELLCLAAATAGLHATQKNDYPITVMRGHSVSEIVCSETPIDYTGIERPTTIIALGQEGVNRKKAMFRDLGADTLIVKAGDVELPASGGAVMEVDFKAENIRSGDRALTALARLAADNRVLSRDMLITALKLRFSGKTLDSVLATVG
jgi:2-oxoglutarate ferredoxin oxidoreductase subunit beta